MKTTIRNRAAALGVAAVAGIAGIGLASGPALADTAPAAATASGDAEAGQSVDPQSVYYPKDPVKYADEFVIAWGQGNTDRVEAFASPQVVEVLNEHGDDDATHWDRVGAEGAAGTVYVDYENTVTGEKMSLGLPNEAVSNPDNEWGEPNGVHKIQFGD